MTVIDMMMNSLNKEEVKNPLNEIMLFLQTKIIKDARRERERDKK